MRLTLALITAGLAGPALAHGGDTHIWSLDATWTTDLRIIVPLYATALLYLVGTQRVWARAGTGRGVRYGQAACFWVGWIVLALSLLSPLHWLAEHLFTAHMVEHELIMAVAAPLLVLARPGGAILWALPVSWRSALGRTAANPVAAWLWRSHTDPVVATVMHGAAIWLWHVPALFEAAVANETLHWLQHLSFLVTGLFFWWALIFGRARRRGFGAAAMYLFATAGHTGLLGVLLTLAKRPLYPVQTAFAAEWGLTPLEDQQLAGLVMWVPAGLVYAGAAIVLTGLWIARSGGSPREGQLARAA